jgi:hypothetical protein
MKFWHEVRHKFLQKVELLDYWTKDFNKGAEESVREEWVTKVNNKVLGAASSRNNNAKATRRDKLLKFVLQWNTHVSKQTQAWLTLMVCFPTHRIKLLIYVSLARIFVRWYYCNDTWQRPYKVGD